MDISNLNISKLKHKMDVSNLTLRVFGENVDKAGRFYVLWRNGNFITIQAEPWSRPGFVNDFPSPAGQTLEQVRALRYIEEVLQTMLDTIVFDSENNWAYLVRLKNSTYRLKYARRQLLQNCMIWTKVVELDDIEVTRFTSGFLWEGIYEGKDVDLLIGCNDHWADYVFHESRGQKLVESRGIGHYFFGLIAHVSKNGMIVGIMVEALVGRCVTPADRAVVFEAISDIQRHGVLFCFQLCDIYITERGVRFTSASSAEYYPDRDVLAKEAGSTWQLLAGMFDHMDADPRRGHLTGSRALSSSAVIIPRLPSPGRPITLTPQEARIRWVWSITISDAYSRLGGRPLIESQRLSRLAKPSATRQGKKLLLPPAESYGDSGASDESIASMDKPLVVFRGTRQHPYAYARLRPKRLPLPQESD